MPTCACTVHISLAPQRASSTSFSPLPSEKARRMVAVAQPMHPSHRQAYRLIRVGRGAQEVDQYQYSDCKWATEGWMLRVDAATASAGAPSCRRTCRTCRGRSRSEMREMRSKMYSISAAPVATHTRHTHTQLLPCTKHPSMCRRRREDGTKEVHSTCTNDMRRREQLQLDGWAFGKHGVSVCTCAAAPAAVHKPKPIVAVSLMPTQSRHDS
jgi:hypothetical protein